MCFILSGSLPLVFVAPLKVTYDFNRARMLVEPVLLTVFFLALFLVAMLAGRIDMRIRKGGRASSTG